MPSQNQLSKTIRNKANYRNQFTLITRALFTLAFMISSAGVNPTAAKTAQKGPLSSDNFTVQNGPTFAPDCGSPANEIVAENCLTGNPPSEWDVSGAGDETIQGFATDISVNRGGTIDFKINTTAPSYSIPIYRLGYYGGNGARLVATIPSTEVTATEQSECLSSDIEIVGSTTAGKLLDCGNWSVSASWQVPAEAISGVYIARPTRTDNGGASHIPFIVRNDSSHSDLLFQTSDTTWQAYNPYGGYNAYGSSGATMAEKLSYNRPFTTRGAELENYLFNAEYPMIRWLERNGYDVSYTSAIDIERHADLITNHQVYMSVGHDEYWSQGRRDAVTAARDAGVNLAFFSGNEIYWKIRWEADSNGQPYRTRVNYKEGSLAPSGSVEHRNCYNNYNCDPSGIWTGLWREAPGSTPENSLSGQISWRLNTGPITVPGEFAHLRFWRNTAVAALEPAGQVTLADGTLGYEWDPEYPQYAASYPAGRILLSTTNVTSFIGPEQHHLSLYRAPSGALVFGAGTVQWAWGLDGNHDRGTSTEDPNIQQATVNLFADMGVQSASLQSNLTVATASTDTIAPVSTITSPLDGATVNGLVTVLGTAADTGGGVVGAVEVSVDGGITWQAAAGRENWSYSWTPSTLGSVNIKSRAVDDSGNIETPSAGITVTVEPRTCPCSIWNDSTLPDVASVTDNQPIEVGVRFQVDIDGYVTGLRFYKGNLNTGTHIGHLWTNTGIQLAEATFTGESTSGWQEVTLASPVAVQAGTTYVASYHSTGYFADNNSPYFTSGNVAAYTNPPVRAMTDGVDGSNGVFKYGASAFPDQTWSQSNYWVDVVFATTVSPDTTPPVVNSVAPANNATNAPISTNISAVFDEPLDAATVSGTTFELRDAAAMLVPATVTYNNTLHTATLAPSAALAYSTVYTATLKGGTTDPRIKDQAGNALVADQTWTFTTAAEPAPPPDEGPGGPILVIADATNVSNPFGRYYAEILRGEGFNVFTATDITKVTAATLNDYDIVLLGEMPLNPTQVSMFDNWVNGGGDLIAFRPAKSLAALYGLTDASATTSEGYLAVNTSTAIGKGVIGDTLQFHGTADNYTLSDATSVATLYTDATTPTSYPAIASYTRGTGQVVIFTFDLARSIILMRQGNPAWAGTEGDGHTDAIRATDLFVHDSQSWLDANKIAIPQADEQMHLLSHAIEQLTASKLPLPRLWYFPNQVKGALIMTGDSEGCSTACVNIPMADVNAHGGHYTVYLEGNGPSSADVSGWLSAGNGVGAHYNDTANATDPTYNNMKTVYDAETPAFLAAYDFTPATVRNHWVLWAGWADQAKVEVEHGLGLDTNYYHWGSWTATPGYFTGSGLPLRFSDENGQILDIFQATTQLPDETWFASISTQFKTLIDRSVDQGYYGFLTANFHPPSYGTYQTAADSMMDYANARGVPIWSAEQLNDFLRARNQARTQNMSWNGTLLNFDFNALIPYNELTLMIPAKAGGHSLASLEIGSTSVPYTITTIKGYDYALFTAANGSYTAAYEQDTTTPTITSHTPIDNATSVAVNSNVMVTFSEAMDPATITGTTFSLQADGAPGNVAASITYDDASMTATLHPTTNLAYSTLYHMTVSGIVTDVSSNPLGSDQTWNFTTQASPPPSVTDTTAADFGLGTLNSCVADATIGDGAVRLPAGVEEDFSGTTLPAGWTSYDWPYDSKTGVYSVSGGLLSVDGVRVNPDPAAYGPGSSLEFVATFATIPNQHIGFGSGSNLPPNSVFDNTPPVWAIFSTGSTGSGLMARTWSDAGHTDFTIPGSWLGSPHLYRIDWTSTSATYFIDGSQVASQAYSSTDTTMRPALSDLTQDGTVLSVDSMRVTPYVSPCTFTSRIFDAGGPVSWGTMSWNATLPSGTSLTLSYRRGNTPAPDGSWTEFSSVPSSGSDLSGNSRYIQYQVGLSASDTSQTPALQDVTITYVTGGLDVTPPTVTGRTPAPNATGVTADTNVTVTFDEAMNAGSINGSTFSLRADGAGSDIPGAVTYDAGSMTATLNPNADLAYSTLYHVTVFGTVTDLAGNPLGSDSTWNFTTATAPLPVLSDTTAADFSAGTINSCVVDAIIGDGAVRLPLVIDEDFSGTAFPSAWTSNIWSGSALPTVGNSLLSVNGNQAYTSAVYTAGHTLQFRATFDAHTYESVGFAGGNPPLNSPPWLQFGTGTTGTQLYARILASGGTAGGGDDMIPLGAAYLGTPHTYRIDWKTNGLEFFIDGVSVVSRSTTFNESMHVVASDYTSDANSVTVDWIQLTPYATPCTFTSRVFDTGQSVNWGTLAWTGTTPSGTTLSLSYHIGNTSTPNDTWTSFIPVTSSGDALAGNSRYIQYRAALETSDSTRTPALQDVTITYALGSDSTPPMVIGRSPAPGTSGVGVSSNVEVTFNELIQETSLTSTTFRLRAADASNDISAVITLAGNLATLDPTADLAPFTTYRVIVAAGVTDLNGNQLGTDDTWIFTTGMVMLSATDTSVADFSAGTPGACAVDATLGDGALRLPFTIDENFAGTALPVGWSGYTWTTGGTYNVSGGLLTMNGTSVRNDTLYSPGSTLEFVATFGAGNFEHVGFGGGTITFNQAPIVMFSTRATTNTLYTSIYTGAYTDIAISNSSALIGTPHRYRIDWKTTGFDFYVDGILVSSRTTVITEQMRVAASEYNAGGVALSVDWMHMTPFISLCSFTSRVIDAGQTAHWLELSSTGSTPPETSVGFETRSGNTTLPDGSWSDWEAANGPIASPNGQYVQYRASLTSTDPALTPVIESVTITYGNVLTPTITWSDPADISYGTSLSAIQLNATASVPGTFTYTPDMGTILNVGVHTLRVEFTPEDLAYFATASKNVTIEVTKATAIVMLGGLSHTYDATEKSATATTTPIGLTVTFTYDGVGTKPVNVGSYAVVGTINDANYTGSASGTLEISQATLIVTAAHQTKVFGAVNPALTFAYSGFLGADDKTILTAEPTCSTLAVQYSSVGSYPISCVGGVDNNYTFSYVGNTLDITKAASLVTVTCPETPQMYTGSAIQPCTAAYSGVGGLSGSLTPTYSDNLNVGLSARADATYGGDANHFGSTNFDTFTISPASASITLSNLSPVFDGMQKSVTVVTSPPGLSVRVIYTPDGTTTEPSDPGTYTVDATITDPNYSGSASAIMHIQSTHSLTLVPGWNLVSFPLVPMDTAPGTVLNNIVGKYDLVYGWDGSATTNNWKKFAPGGPGYANDLTRMDETMGFWIHMSVGATLNVIGNAPSSTNIPLSIAGGGWNLVGYPSSVGVPPDPANLPVALSGHGVTDFTLVYAYHAYDTADLWKLYDKDAPAFASDLKSLTNGWGYWVKVSNNQTWHVEY